MRLKGFIGGAYTLPSVAAECQACVNLFPELNEARTAANGEVGVLRRIHGHRPYTELPKTPVRGTYTSSQGVLYAVAGDHFYQIKATGEIVDLGSILTSTGPVSMMDNGLQLLLVDGTYGYYYVFATPLTPIAQVTDDGFFAGTKARFLDGYAIVNRAGTSEYHFSALNDVTNWDATDYQKASGSPDNLVTHETFNKQLWLFGRDTLEIHYDTGDATTPFQPVPGGLLQMGCASPYCVEIVKNTILWLDSSPGGFGTVWKSTGMAPERVSTHAIEQKLASYGDLSGAYSWSYEDGGHGFYCLSIPFTHSTWVYDLATSLWHERVSIDSHSREQVNRIGYHAFAYNRHFLGDYSTGDIYVMDPEYHLDGTMPIIWRRSSPHINSGYKRIFYKRFQLDMETGTGLATGQGSDPVVTLRYSNDRGHTWTPPNPRSMGAIGKYADRVQWWQLGSSRDRVFEVSGSEPIATTLLGAEIDAEEGLI